MLPAEAIRLVFDFLEEFSPEKVPPFVCALKEALNTSSETIATSTHNAVNNLHSSLEVSAIRVQLSFMYFFKEY